MHGARTRASTVNVFRQIIRMLETIKEDRPADVKQAMDLMAPRWLGAFEQLLERNAAEEVQRDWETLAIRVEIFLVRCPSQHYCGVGS